MPEHSDITDLLSGTNINFFHCVKIVEILKETEKDSKNFFGQYGSQRMTDWKEILGLYEKENIFLAEASQLLIQAVVYEIPGFKKQITKVPLNKLKMYSLCFFKCYMSCQISYGLFFSFLKAAQTQDECDKKEKENIKKSEEFRHEYTNACKNLGIDGSSTKTSEIKKAIIGLLEDLPKTYTRIAEESKTLESCR